MRRRIALLAVIALGAAALAGADRDAGLRIDPAHPPRFSHVAVVVLENRGYRVLRSPEATYLRTLGRRYGIATRYYGVSHPSLPNYLALTAGATFHVASDCRGCQIDRMSLFDQLNAAQISWKAYLQGGRVNTGRVDPLRHYEQTADGSMNGHFADFSGLAADLRARRLPQFSWLSLGLCHDGHYCSTEFSDDYLSHLLPRLLRGVGPHGVVFVTWDEGTTNGGSAPGPGGGRVPLIAAGGGALPHVRSALPVNHYALLHMIESSFGLPPLRKAAAAPLRPLNRLLADSASSPRLRG
jgi:phosphatidylinositol-3-phosphatase